ncbi:hypothetical protein SAY86_015659 [Trapa natans]|uniref:CP12 domain-containing protein n=1 Tax=Trapa natans TaxID=22666 RepID=A0AAN7L862_TRANT|nr:hypothetical protein SAY86_015659 [Trapa natans]
MTRQLLIGCPSIRPLCSKSIAFPNKTSPSPLQPVPLLHLPFQLFSLKSLPHRSEMALAATLNGLALSIPSHRVLLSPRAAPTRPQAMSVAVKAAPWGGWWSRRMTRPAAVVAAAPDSLEDKVVESIKNAEEACSGDPASGECVAAWDEVEELSAAVSHKRDKNKAYDPLENYCKDNPETEECRTYDN